MQKKNFTLAIKFPKSCVANFLFLIVYKDVNVKYFIFTNDLEDFDSVERKYSLCTLQKDLAEMESARADDVVFVCDWT